MNFIELPDKKIINIDRALFIYEDTRDGEVCTIIDYGIKQVVINEWPGELTGYECIKEILEL